MKIDIEIDITPEEFRTLMGWPDIQDLQNDLIEEFREQMAAKAKGYDPLSLMGPYLAQSMGSLDALQKMMGGLMQGYAKGGGTDTKE